MFAPAFRFLLVVAELALARAAIARGSAAGWVLLVGVALLAVGFWRSGSVRDAIARARGESLAEWVEARLAQLEQRLAWL